MKTAKLIILSLLVFIISGCDIDYNIEINDTYITENITVNDYIIGNRSIEDIKEVYNYYIPVYGSDSIDMFDAIKKNETEYYSKKIISSSENGYNYSLSYSHKSLDDYQKSLFWTYLLDGGKSIITDNNTISIWTGNGNKLFKANENVSSIKINIKTALKVTEHNADSVRGNTYTWEFTKENQDLKNIKMVINKDNSLENETENPNPNPQEENTKEPELENDSSQDSEEKTSNNWVLILSMLGIFFIVLLILLKIKK